MREVYNTVTLQLNGSIRVDSREGEGFCCTIRMPDVSPSPEHLGMQHSAGMV